MTLGFIRFASLLIPTLTSPSRVSHNGTCNKLVVGFLLRQRFPTADSVNDESALLLPFCTAGTSSLLTSLLAPALPENVDGSNTLGNCDMVCLRGGLIEKRHLPAHVVNLSACVGESSQYAFTFFTIDFVKPMLLPFWKIHPVAANGECPLILACRLAHYPCRLVD